MLKRAVQLSASAMQDQSSSTTPGNANTSSASTEAANAFVIDWHHQVRRTGTPRLRTPFVNAKEERPRDKDTKRLKHVVSQIPRASAPFFQWRIGVATLGRSRRSRRRAGIISESDALIKHLEQMSFILYFGVQPYDYSPCQRRDALVGFVRIGGFDTFSGLYREFVSTIETTSTVNVEQRTEVTVWKGVRVRCIEP
ncbi:hypothetical protein LXA43DRAFT_1101955 [Ganoderma leucocontextum]|nr:hypothetical protein LXA43DRAFT_1101955 [Ganoderma leucocontextum]